MGGKNSGKPKGELLFLDGREMINGKIQKTDFFNFLGMDLSDYSNVQLTPEEALAFKNSMVRITHGVSAAIPLVCCGTSCINHLCPFHQSKNYPILGKQCLFEARMLQALTKSYMEDIGVEPESRSEMTLINKLVECDMIDFRANLGLSGYKDEEAGQLLKTNTVESEHGVAETTTLHPLMMAKEQVNKTRLKILESMVGTRREKYKKAAALKQREQDDSSNFLAAMKERLSGVSQKPNNIDKIEEAADEVASLIEADWTSDGE